MKPGDRVSTWMDEIGVIVGPAPLKYQPYDWMVLVDGDKEPCPYMDQEIILVEE
jgi:hypothetical protein